MSGDKELFEMMRSRGTSGGQLPSASVHFIPAADAPRVLGIDRRIQKIKRYRGWIIAGAILLAFLIGVSV